MSEPILDPEYWRQRLESAKEQHHAVYCTTGHDWNRICAKHRDILRREIKSGWSILDVGCGWGRLFELLPEWWIAQNNDYLGVDLSPDFVELAQRTYGTRQFVCADIRDVMPPMGKRFDVAILISIRPMMLNHVGADVWNDVEKHIRSMAKQILYLEYNHLDEGSFS